MAIAGKSGSSLAVKFVTPVELCGMPLPRSHHWPSVGYGEAAIEKMFSTAVEFPTAPPPCVFLIEPNRTTGSLAAGAEPPRWAPPGSSVDGRSQERSPLPAKALGSETTAEPIANRITRGNSCRRPSEGIGSQHSGIHNEQPCG